MKKQNVNILNRELYQAPVIETIRLKVEAGFSTSGITEDIIIDSEIIDIS